MDAIRFWMTTDWSVGIRDLSVRVSFSAERDETGTRIGMMLEASEAFPLVQ
jgi:hypothetical protein